jgi:hypothetical protein
MSFIGFPAFTGLMSDGTLTALIGFMSFIGFRVPLA